MRLRSIRRVVFWIFLIFFTCVLFLVVRSYVFRTFRVVSNSMHPTLQEGDRVLVSMMAYRIPPVLVSLHLISESVLLPARGDIVVFSRFSEYQTHHLDTHYIKRIVGIPGDSIGVVDDEVVLGARGDDGRHYQYGPVLLGPAEYFVVGDNPANSKDSRYFGPIHRRDVEGKALMIVWSTRKDLGRTIVQTNRIGITF